MRRSIWLAVFFALLSVSGALACLNDRETVVVEREFRSRYESASNPGAAESGAAAAQGRPDLPTRSEWNVYGMALTLAGVVLIVGDVKFMRRKRPDRLRYAIGLGIAAVPFGAFIYSALLTNGDVRNGGLRTEVITYPAAYELPEIPGGTSFRMAMLHDVLMERYLRHGQAWYEKRNQESRAAIDEERPKPGPTTRMLDSMDDLAVGLENLHKSGEAAAVMRDKLILLPHIDIKPPAAPAPISRTGYSAEREEVERLEQIVAAAKMPPEMHQQYTARANLGTSLIHGAFPKLLAGDAAAPDQMREGLELIEQAIAINPGAHFGRETWQAIVVRHFLATRDHPELRTQFDVIGADLAEVALQDIRSQMVGYLSAPADWLDANASIEDRVAERTRIPSVDTSATWSAVVDPELASQVPFDEPALALMGMWMLGGGPNPNSAMAMADIAVQVGQNEIAWDGFERALEMKESFSPDAKVRQALVDYCAKQQAVIAKYESPDAPDEWTTKTRQRHVAELAWARQYQDDYHAWEAKQIAAGIALDDPSFYTGFFHGRPSIASPVGHVDEVEKRFFAPDSILDGAPAGVLLAGIFMLLAAMSKARSP